MEQGLHTDSTTSNIVWAQIYPNFDKSWAFPKASN